jgi:YD repeat-containing protein
MQYQYEADGLVSDVVTLRNDVNGDAQLSGVVHFSYTDVDDTGDHIGRWLESTTYGGDDPEVNGLSLVNTSTVSITHNEFGMPLAVEDEIGRVTAYEYDDLDRLTKVTLPDPGDDQPQPVTEYAYTLAGLLTDVVRTSVDSEESITTHYCFDDNGRVAHVFQDYGGPDVAETSYTYELAGNVTEKTDALEHSTHYAYDVLNRPVAITQEDPDGSGPLAAPVTLLIYDALGRIVGKRDPEEAIWQWQYDDLERIAAQIDPEAGVTTWEYNAALQLSSVTDPEEQVTSYDYDEAGRLMSLQRPGETSPTEYQYDSAGNLRFVIDPLEHTSETIYDERRRVTEQIAANNASTTYTYFDDNQLESLTDADLNTTTWAYDDAGRVASETNSLEHARTYHYDAYGRLAEKVDQ